jgi:hypothetical protein
LICAKFVTAIQLERFSLLGTIPAHQKGRTSRRVQALGDRVSEVLLQKQYFGCNLLRLPRRTIIQNAQCLHELSPAIDQAALYAMDAGLLLRGNLLPKKVAALRFVLQMPEDRQLQFLEACAKPQSLIRMLRTSLRRAPPFSAVPSFYADSGTLLC